MSALLEEEKPFSIMEAFLKEEKRKKTTSSNIEAFLEEKKGVKKTFSNMEAFLEELFFQLGKMETYRTYYDVLTSANSLKQLETSFTSSTFNQKENYEYFEQLGDLTINKAIVNYMYKRFPHLKCPEGVKTVARLRIKYASKQKLSELARRFKFLTYIRASNEEKEIHENRLLEDVFEAFFGALEGIIDENYGVGLGYRLCADIIESMLNRVNVSLQHNALYDAKSRLKELFEKHSKRLGKLEWHCTDNMLNGTRCFIAEVKSNGILYGTGIATNKMGAQQNAAKSALACIENILN